MKVKLIKKSIFLTHPHTMAVVPLIMILSLCWTLISVHSVFAEDTADITKKLGTIKGQILHEDGKIFTPGMLALFASENLDPMDYGQSMRAPKMIAFLNKQGKFTTHLMPKGSYFVGVIPRKAGRGGPPRSDETRYSAFDKDGKYLVVTLKEGQTLDIGAIVVKEPPKKPELTDYFTMKGKLLDKDGKGLSGVRVVLRHDYDNPKGDFVSAPSAADGSYSIRIPPGKYFAVARKTVDGSMRPRPGSIYGELGQDKAIGVGGKRGSLMTFIVGRSGQVYEHADIKMFKVPIPDVKRKETEALVKANKIQKEDLSKDLPLRKKSPKGEVKSGLRPLTPYKTK